MSEPFYYRLISEDEMDPAVLGDAHCILNYCTRVLDIFGCKIQWVRSISKADVDIEDSLYRFRKIVAQSFGGKWPKLEYYVSKRGEFYGAVFPLMREKTIYVRADLSLRRILGAIAHECKHMSEFGPGAPGPFPIRLEDDAASEARAERFAEETLSVLNIQD